MAPPTPVQPAHSPQRQRKLALGLGLALTALAAAWGIHHWQQSREERKLFATLKPYFTSDAVASYEALPLSHRLKTARRALPALEALQDASWGISVTDLREGTEEETKELVYQLGVGDTELLDCSVPDPFGDPAGACARFRHVVSTSSTTGAGEPRLQEVPLELHFSESPYAESAGEARLALGHGAGAQITGVVRVDAQDVIVRDPVVLIPKPFEPEQLEAVPIADFSPRTETALRAVRSTTYDASLPMPALLGPFFGDASNLQVIHAAGALAVDLTGDAPLYRYEGELSLLTQYIGRGVVEYVPGQYASLGITDARIPSALPQVCFHIEQALAEVDFSRKSLRLAGRMEFETVDSFLCDSTAIGQEMGFFTRAGLGFALGAAREGLGLPPYVISRGHLLFDLDDGIVCGDLAVNGHSLFHAAYLGNSHTFQMWAPRGFLADDIRPGRPLSSLWDLGVGAFTADWSFPESNPQQCWDGDPGPRTNLDISILPGWQPQTASLEASETY